MKLIILHLSSSYLNYITSIADQRYIDTNSWKKKKKWILKYMTSVTNKIKLSVITSSLQYKWKAIFVKLLDIKKSFWIDQNRKRIHNTWTYCIMKKIDKKILMY